MVRFIFLVLLRILLIVRSFVKVLKWYCWDKSGLHHKDLNNFCIESVSGFLTHVLWAILFYLFQIVLNRNLSREKSRALILHMNIPCDTCMIFIFVLNPWTWHLTNFSLILQMVISCIKIFLLASKYLSLWSWSSLELASHRGIWVFFLQTHLV